MCSPSVNSFPHDWMRRCTSLFLLFLLVCGSLTLTPDEETALQAFYDSIPALSQALPPWTSNVSQACEAPGFYGLTCSSDSDPHVLGLYVPQLLAPTLWRSLSLLAHLFQNSNALFPISLIVSKLLFNPRPLCLSAKGVHTAFLPPNAVRPLNCDLMHSVPSIAHSNPQLSSSIEYACLSMVLQDDIANLKDLRVLRLLGNHCSLEAASTTLPVGLTNLTRLEEISIRYGDIVGTIPEGIGLLASLRIFNLTVPSLAEPMALAGSIPESMRDLQRLEVLKLDGTTITGWHRTHLAPTFPLLTELSLSHSARFAGPVSALIEAAPNLKIMDLSNTYAPIDFSTLPPNLVLEILVLDRFKSAGDLGANFWRSLTRLKYFSANDAHLLTGSIHSSIGRMINLTYLDLSFTKVSGTIPQEMRALTQLEFLSLCDTQGLRVPLPDIFGDLKVLKTLRVRRLQGLAVPIPQSIGDLRSIENLELSNCHLTGLIPEGLIYAPNLKSLQLPYNALDGTIPNFSQRGLKDVRLQENKLTGSVPRSLASWSTSLYLNNNLLGPELPEDIFAARSVQGTIDLSNNNFTSLLPNATNVALGQLTLSGNKFYGTIPSSYCNTSTYLRLDHNRLSGSLDPLLADGCGATLTGLYVNDNQFSGTIPHFDHTSIESLVAGSNFLESPLPRLSRMTRSIDLNNNRISEYGLLVWTGQEHYRGVKYLDLSNNEIHSSLPLSIMLHPNLEYLSLAGSRFLSAEAAELSSMLSLDLSNCGFSGALPSFYWPRISSLTISNNHFTGKFDLPFTLTRLDISDNEFTFEANSFRDAPMLISLNASHNSIFGTLDVSSLHDLQSADLSFNHLDYAPDFASIGDLFHRYSLRVINIANNPIPTLNDLDTESTGLNRSSSSSPSTLYRDSIKCYALEFWNTTGSSFIFDEDLFNYLQCDCDDSHFGLPLQCHACPAQGMKSCSNTRAVVDKNFFATWSVPAANGTHRNDSDLAGSNTSPWHRNHQRSTKDPEGLSTETCMRTAVHTLSGKSNCRGVELSPSNFARFNHSIEMLLASQCEEGSSGRMCSRCLCHQGGVADCFYERGPYVLPINDFANLQPPILTPLSSSF